MEDHVCKLEDENFKCPIETKNSTLQIINTVLLSIMSIASVAMFTKINTVNNTMIELKNADSEMRTEQVRMKTVQDINTNNISLQEGRLLNVENEKIGEMKEWTEKYFVRKK